MFFVPVSVQPTVKFRQRLLLPVTFWLVVGVIGSAGGGSGKSNGPGNTSCPSVTVAPPVTSRPGSAKALQGPIPPLGEDELPLITVAIPETWTLPFDPMLPQLLV